ncbi:hypothetical protein D910_02278 [Dendroctonus ponderosae]|uniref:DUF4746 domain-containing protein n=2 Tax=Dendroctonus ponderosae TaxID=77166 RepID=U4TTM0_DENPD|nr:hypothetical protein D910_02278 [Dendroctonus ponderosae]
MSETSTFRSHELDLTKVIKVPPPTFGPYEPDQVRLEVDPPTFGPSSRISSEKLVLQVSKKKSECIFAFAQLEPLYMSPNSNEGKIECEKFFPEDYNAGETEEEEEEEEKQPEDSADKPEVQGEGEEQDEYVDNEPTEEIGEAGESADSPETEKPEGEESDVNEPTETPNEEVPETNENIQTADPVPTEPVEEEPVKLTEDILEELLYFGDIEFSSKTLDDLGGNRLTFALLFKRTNAHLAGNIDDIVLQMVYGNSRKPPGDHKSPACKLRKVWKSTGKPIDWVEVAENLSEEELGEIEDNVLLGIWAPPNSLSRAMILKLLFPALSNPFKLPEQEEIPLHVAVAFDAFKAKDVFEISDKYPGKVMSIGYFSSDVPGKAKLLGKTTEQFEARPASLTYEEKIVIQLAKDNAQCFMEFMDLGPSYISTDIEVGAADCFYFFPPGYNTPESEIITYLKKKSKRKGKHYLIRE